ncbi:adenosine deaminase 2 [Lingula anatina]|uniref:Adenosine deaminase 2 n=1 Tax=Lingula anatina TaxID=7574 RepID=A0A1S3IS42_LINAN|nr:adenosine deaminase 2 [Lingula anatina]|eukprot:XP_013401030.1 adenosine deaminase 2 [Lingula anatina]
MLVFCVCLLVFFASVGAKTPFMSEYEFSRQRDELMAKEWMFAGHAMDLTDDEKIVDNYLEYLKWQEFMATKDRFPPSVGLESVLDHIVNSKVFKTLKTFPKGGNMHLHENHVLSKSKMLDIVYSSDDYEHLYVAVNVSNNYKWRLDFFLNPPKGWEKVKGNPKYTKEKLLPHMHLLGSMTEYAKENPTNSGQRWKETDPMFSRLGSEVIANANIKEKYLKGILEAAVEENVQYLETRTSLSGRLYVLDSDPKYTSNHGKRYIDTSDGELEIQQSIQTIDAFVKKNPHFIGLRKIANSFRRKTMQEMYIDMEKAIRMHLKYPNYIAGFDMVGEEDRGNSLLYYMEDFLKLYDNATGESRVPFYLHNGETNWPDDLLTASNANDPVGTLQNTYEAVLLGAKRVGHGLGYFKHPYLLDLLKQHQTAIEVCPVSNQLLGYTADLRNHPAINFIRMGVPVILGADDPATFGYNYFTADWYEAFMGWGLRLPDLKKLAINSLHYSAMTTKEKVSAINEKWKPAYSKFIADIKREACSIDFSNTTNEPFIARIFPREGPMKASSKIHVFGRNFEQAICQGVVCKFDNTMTSGSYVSGQQLSCKVPDFKSIGKTDVGNSVPVRLRVSVDGGATFLPYNSQFTYVSDGTSEPFIG